VDAVDAAFRSFAAVPDTAVAAMTADISADGTLRGPLGRDSAQRLMSAVMAATAVSGTAATIETAGPPRHDRESTAIATITAATAVSAAAAAEWGAEAGRGPLLLPIRAESRVEILRGAPPLRERGFAGRRTSSSAGPVAAICCGWLSNGDRAVTVLAECPSESSS